MENRQGEGENSVGNLEAKELLSMTIGIKYCAYLKHLEEGKGEKSDNYNRITILKSLKKKVK